MAAALLAPTDGTARPGPPPAAAPALTSSSDLTSPSAAPARPRTPAEDTGAGTGTGTGLVPAEAAAPEPVDPHGHDAHTHVQPAPSTDGPPPDRTPTGTDVTTPTDTRPADQDAAAAAPGLPAPAAPAPAPAAVPAAPAAAPAAPAAVTGTSPAPPAAVVAAPGPAAPAPSSDPPAAAVPDGAAPAPSPDRSEAAAARPVAPGVVTGTLTRLWAEQLVVGHDAEEQAWLVDGEDGYRVPTEALADVADGSRVTADLAAPDRVGAEHPVLALRRVEAPLLAAGAVAWGEGDEQPFGLAAAGVVHDVTVVLALPPGASADSMTTDRLKATVDGGVNGFWAEQTRGRRGFRVAATHGWQRLTKGCNDAWGLWQEAADRVGFVPGPRRHLLLYIPPAAGCGAGLGSVNSPDAGGVSWVGHDSQAVIAHELGHNLGLGHSNGLLCSDRPDSTWGSSGWQPGCFTQDYRDYYDVMGVSWGYTGSLAGPQAEALGVLTSVDRLQTSAPVRSHLVPTTGEGLRVLRIDDPAGTYYVEYRVAAGRDSWLAGNPKGLDAGVLVRRSSPGGNREFLLLDGSVTGGARTGDWASALRPGTSLLTASGRTRIAVESQSATGATVVVSRDGVGPGAVAPLQDGQQVGITAPGAYAARGSIVFAGVATAPEGTLGWEILQDGVVRNSGVTRTGANGTFDTFQVPITLPAGTFTFRATVPDDSDGESTARPGTLVAETTLTVS